MVGSELLVPLRRVVLLCLTAGYVDAVGYRDLGGVFTANMTGNTVLLGIALARGELERTASYVTTLVSFFIGALLASVLARFFERRFLAIFFIAGLLAAIQFLRLDRMEELVILAAAIGMQGVSLSRFGGVGLQTVVVTGTLLRLAEALVVTALPVSTRGISAPRGAIAIPLASWAAYGFGAMFAAGGLLFDMPLLVPAALLVAAAADLMLGGAET